MSEKVYRINEIEPIAKPKLANQIAKRLDEYVLQELTDEKLYMLIKTDLSHYVERYKAWQKAEDGSQLRGYNDMVKKIKEFHAQLETAHEETKENEEKEI